MFTGKGSSSTTSSQFDHLLPFVQLWISIATRTTSKNNSTCPLTINPEIPSFKIPFFQTFALNFSKKKKKKNVWKYIVLPSYYSSSRVLLSRKIRVYRLDEITTSIELRAYTYTHIRGVKYVGINVWPEQFAFNRLPAIDIGKKFLKMRFLKATMPRVLECLIECTRLERVMDEMQMRKIQIAIYFVDGINL